MNLERLFHGKAIFDDAENLCDNLNATFSSPESYEDVQSVLQQSDDTIIKIWTPMIKISTTEYTDGERGSWTLQSLSKRPSMKVCFGELAYVKVTGKKIVHTVLIILWVTLTLRNTLDMSNTCIRMMIESSSASGIFSAKK